MTINARFKMCTPLAACMAVFWFLGVGSVLFPAGCDALNSGFVNLIDPMGNSGLVTLDNAPGHLIVSFNNRAEVDERLLAFLQSAEGGNLVLSEADRRSLRPRVRLRVQVTYVDLSVQVVEFVDGSSRLVDQRFDTSAFADLNQNDLNNVVVLCDVADIRIQPGTGVEIFMPVELTAFQLIEATNPAGGTSITFEPRDRMPPQFRTMQVDDVDEDGNVVLRRNIGIQDVSSPALGPSCGSVISLIMDGVLSVPFLDGVSNAPSFDQDDEATIAGIGGRYEFIVSAQ